LLSDVLLDDGGRSPGLLTDPTEDKDASEAADDIAAGCSQGLLGGADKVWSLEVDLRNC
jgi:hypothetical protein